MEKTAKLKVFTTAIGFYDVLVAAPSRAAALRAWGSEHDLFARGMASEVTDPDTIAEPLARPGEVIRRARGGKGDAAAGKSKKLTKTSPPRTAHLPRPSRQPVQEAERALASTKARHKTEDAEFKAKVEAAQRQRREAQERATKEERKLTHAVKEARDRYHAEFERWQRATD